MRDPYVDSNGVLINKLNIKSYDLLQKAEANIGFVKLINVDSIPVDGFDEDLLKRIHFHIFGDIFEWAGQYRKVPLVKEEFIFPGYSLPYTDYKDIHKELKRQLEELNAIDWEHMSPEEIASIYARKIALLWKVHPFRDGNTRTFLSFSYLYAKKHGFPFSMEVFTENLSRLYNTDGRVSRHSVRDKFVLASLADKDYPETAPLAAVFEEAMKKYREGEQDKYKKDIYR